MKVIKVIIAILFALTAVAGLSLAVCASQEDAAEIAGPRGGPAAAGWLSRHEALKQQAVAAQPQLVFLGDSIVENWALAGFGKPIWDKNYAKAVNMGIQGETTQNLLWRIENGALDNISPKTVILMIGGLNNLAFAEPPSVAKGVKKVGSAIRRKLPSARLIVLSVLPFIDRDHTMKVAELNRLISQDAGSFKGDFLDVSDIVLDSHGELQPKMFEKQRVHVTLPAYAAMTARLNDHLALKD